MRRSKSDTSTCLSTARGKKCTTSFPNGSGSTVTFTLIRRAGISEQEFDVDTKTVEKDLLSLKTILENP
jgi:hypothetical protein